MNAQPPEKDRSAIRISDADRERAAQRLHTALAEGRITLAELEERLSVVYAARFESELRPPLADLPGAEIAAAPVAQPAAEPVVLRAGLSSLKRTGPWRVPARLKVHAGVGSVLLDFCDAENPNPVVDLEIEAGAGSVKLLVPDNATADVDGVVPGLGTVKCAVPSGPRPGVPHFVVHGRIAVGSLQVRRRYRFAGHSF